MTPTPTPHHGGQPQPPAPAFPPLELLDVCALSRKTRASLAWDLARARDIGRLRAMEPFIPFSNESGALDAPLCALAFWAADAAWAEPLATRIETLFIAGRRPFAA